MPFTTIILLKQNLHMEFFDAHEANIRLNIVKIYNWVRLVS